MARATARTAPTYEMAAHLLLAERPFSRNRNLAAFDDPRFRPALALYRRLRALVRDLERAGLDVDSRLVVHEEERAGRPSVRLHLTSPRARRTAWLERPAWDLLLRHPGARAAVQALTSR